ncbi:MAG: glycoside hydrolase family 57 protein [Syntrophomonadaceae bacterium]|nr:glycoside hydrolase family 57 protein [Syntrophomonadaceae bacterium]
MDSKLMLVLHSHIPYVKRQGRWPFGEVWLYESMAETYIPMLLSWRRMWEEGLKVPVTLSLSPTLLEQLNSKYIQEQFIGYLKERENLAREEEKYYLAAAEPEMAGLAAFYHRFYRDIRRDFIVEMDKDIVGMARQMQDEGKIEIITTAATHAYLPLLEKNSLERQVEWGKKIYQKYFGCSPRGFWLPECGYFKGMEDVLLEYGFEYFYVDSHAIEGGKPIGVLSQGIDDEVIEIETFASTGLSTYRPYKVEGKDIAVFGRNSMVSHQVWSADYGYPGDIDYREFHKQSPRSGLKYWRVTDRNNTESKMVYHSEQAREKVREHAGHFIDSLQTTGKEARKLGFASPLIVGCYDTELFGHWWWEGVQWLEEVIRQVNARENIDLILPQDAGQARHEAQLHESSWGMGGKHYVWHNDETAWMWDIIKKAGGEYDDLKIFADGSLLSQDVVEQALKELLLIESSDWLFMVSGNQTRDYAMKRFFEHYTKLLRLGESVRNQDLNEEFRQWLRKTQYEDDFFNDL